MKIKLLFFLALFFSFSINAQIDFEPHVTVDDTGGTNDASSVYAADLDGDGDTDMLSASFNDNKIAWYENTNGQGDFGPQQIITDTAIGASSVFATDLDNDGNIDVLATAGLANKIIWFKNLDGQGNFGSEQLITNETAGPTSVFAIDIDNDGDMDVLSGSSDAKMAWYENTNGEGSFGTQQIISTDFEYPLNITAPDLDGDGNLDVLSGSGNNNNKVVWFKNDDGQGSFTQQQILTTDIERPGKVISADLDNDNDLDIVVVSQKMEGHRVIWFENTNGLGNFNNTPNTIYNWGNFGSRPETLVAADFDNDGDTDIAVGTVAEGISWFKNNGAGTFGPKIVVDMAVGNVTEIVASDIDGDGNQDLLMTSDTEDRVAWHKNTNGQGDFAPANILAEINSANGANMVYSEDLDGDGDKDILSALTYDNRIVWQENLDGLGTFSELKTISTVDHPLAVYAGDVDGDGFMDVLSASSGSRLVWYKNLDGQGNFGTEQVISNNTINSPDTVYTVDIDNDGDLDVFSYEGFNLYWQENTDGLGNFGPIQIISNEYIFSESFVAADFDNDGDKDLVASYWGDGTVVWFENLDGQGGFSSGNVIDTLLVAESVDAADFDNDGDMDVVTLDYGNDEVVWYENIDGQGTFGSAKIISTENEGVYSLYAKDFDNDGNEDIVVTALGIDSILLFKNDGQGNFNSQQVISTNVPSSFNVYADDYNGDGKADILACSNSKDKIIWFENNISLSIEENTSKLFNLYPNPTTGLLNIESVSPISEITIYNNLGQSLYNFNNRNQINISSLSKGMYFVKIKDENNQVETKKVIKK